eukprot:1231212-Pleurochrysis_carterae.AAC.1
MRASLRPSAAAQSSRPLCASRSSPRPSAAGLPRTLRVAALSAPGAPGPSWRGGRRKTAPCASVLAPSPSPLRASLPPTPGGAPFCCWGPSARLRRRRR